jgi:prophage regulatory protein
MDPIKMLVRREVESLTGLTRNSLWLRIADGLLTEPVKMGGPNVSRWPASDVEQINRAWIRGASEDEVRALVVSLESERTGAPATPRRTTKREDQREAMRRRRAGAATAAAA